MKSAVVIVLACATLCGCASNGRMDGGRAAAPASAAERAALIDRVKQLEGTWEADVGGQKGRTVFAVTSGGSAVREIMDEGGPHEMTNMYHMDGPTMLMTHYCAMGNQPRMRARAGGPGGGPSGGPIVFESDGVSNFLPEHPGYMGSMTLTFIDADTVRQDWVHLSDGKPGEPFSIVLRRKR